MDGFIRKYEVSHTRQVVTGWGHRGHVVARLGNRGHIGEDVIGLPVERLETAHTWYRRAEVLRLRQKFWKKMKQISLELKHGLI